MNPTHTRPVVGPSRDPRTALERVRSLRGVTWTWRQEARIRDPRPRAIGLLAQDVKAAFPEAVLTDRRGRLRVDYDGLVGALVEAIKELAGRVEQLEKASSDDHSERTLQRADA